MISLLFSRLGSFFVGLMAGAVAACGVYFAVSGDKVVDGGGEGLRRSSDTLSRSEWSEASEIIGGIVFRKDTANSDTFKVVLPDILVDKDTTIKPPNVEGRNVFSSDITVNGLRSSRTYNFLAVPTVRGKPSINVGPRIVTGTFYDPKDGRGIEYNWSVPKYKNKVGLSLSLSYTFATDKVLQAFPSIFWNHRSIKSNVGYNLSNRSELIGPKVKLSYNNILFRF